MGNEKSAYQVPDGALKRFSSMLSVRIFDSRVDRSDGQFHLSRWFRVSLLTDHPVVSVNACYRQFLLDWPCPSPARSSWCVSGRCPHCSPGQQLGSLSSTILGLPCAARSQYLTSRTPFALNLAQGLQLQRPRTRLLILSMRRLRTAGN
jgi:hypothetical protein